MRLKSSIAILSFLTLVFFVASVTSSCGVYSFNDVGTIPDSVKTVRVNFIENRAPYVNPTLSPTLTDRLKQKITSQTRLTSTTNDDAHYDITATITDYSVSTSGVTTRDGRAEASINNLTVTVQITLVNQLSTEPAQNFTVTRNFPFDSSKTLQAAEATLMDEIIRTLTDEIFNRIFSNW